ncbi:protein DEEPER ROOTING 1-like isoform X2 [Carex rostrata]
MFNKPNGRQETSRRDYTSSSLAGHVNISNAHKEEFSHLPEALLAIGTLGTYALKEVKQQSLASNNKIGEQDLSDFTSEEVATLVKELENNGLERGKSTQDQFLDCSTSLIDPNCEDYKNVSTESEIVLSKGRDLLDDPNIMLKKRSISFLIKNLFACRGGFTPVPAPELRDPFSQSRMEKLFKSILRKKIYPQNGTTMPTKKFSQRKHQEKYSIEEVAAQEKGDDGEKWVKTDSEYIVLEI